MALQWMDEFNSYGGSTTRMRDGLYADTNNASLVADPDPSAGGAYCLRCSGIGQGAQGRTRKVLSSGQETVGVALRLWMSTLPPSNDISAVPIVFRNNQNSTLVSVWINSVGAILVRLNQSTEGGTVLASTPGPVLVAHAWQHIEAKVKFHATEGTVEVRVEGVPVIVEEGLNTLGSIAGPCAQIVQLDDKAGTSEGMTWYIKDYVIWDGTGDDINDFIGTCSVMRLAVTADTAFNWTASSGATGFNLIDEAAPDDADYISANDTPPAASVFALADLPEEIVGIRGIMMLGRMRKSDSGDANIQMSMLSDGEVADGADRPITTAFTYWYDIIHNDPNTGNPWTNASLNAATIQVDRTV